MQAAVSIILPTFNRLQYLRDAIDSVFGQPFQDWELIIADDSSDAETWTYLGTLAGMPRVKVLRLSHTGNPPAVRNMALREARAEYIAFLDSDDVWMPQKLQLQIASLRSQRTRRWSYTRCVTVDALLNPVGAANGESRGAIDGWVLITALTDLGRFIVKMQRCGAATRLESVLRRRRALISAGIARVHAANGSRMRVLGTLASSAPFSWRYRAWWYGIAAAVIRAFAPAGVRAILRRRLRGRPDGSAA